MSIRLSQAARILGISPITLRQYCETGKINYKLTPGGQRIFNEHDIRELDRKNNPTAMQDDENDRTDTTNTAYYIRASDGNQQALNNQLKELQDAYGTNAKTYQDKASGLNENRPGLRKLIRDIENGKIQHVRITNKERLTRFGYTYIEHIATTAGADIQVLHETQQSQQEELMQDFMSLIASFSGKYYNLRSIKNQEKLVDEAATTLRNREWHAE